MSKGYFNDIGYKGYIDGEGYMLFEDETAYYEYEATMNKGEVENEIFDTEIQTPSRS